MSSLMPTVFRRWVLSVARSFDVLTHYPDRWRELREIQAIANTDILPCVPPDELSELVPTYFPGVSSDIFTYGELKELTYQELSGYTYGELSAEGAVTVYTYAEMSEMTYGELAEHECEELVGTSGLDIYSHSDFKVFTHDELGVYEHTELSGYTKEGIVEAVTEIHTLKHLWECMDQELNNAFIMPYNGKAGADEYACSRWEAMLGIVPSQDATLEERQFVIYVKMFQVAPYSIRKLQSILDGLLGEGESAIVRDVGNQTLNVTLDLSSRFKSAAIEELLDNIVPANMILNTSIAYTTYDNMANHAHEELSDYTHDEIIVTEL